VTLHTDHPLDSDNPLDLLDEHQPRHRQDDSPGLTAAELVAPTKIPPSRGWRSWLYRSSGGRINVGESPDEQTVRTVRTHLRDTYTIAVLGARGGVGKTTAAATLGDMFASLRKDNVIAVDLDPAGGNLADRIDPTAQDGRAIAGTRISRYSHVRAMTGENSAGLEVAASPHHTQRQTHSLTAAEFVACHDQLAQYYNLILVDCGTDLAHESMQDVLERVNAVVMVTTVTAHGGPGADRKLHTLAATGFGRLADRAVLVLNYKEPPYSRKDRKATDGLAETMSTYFNRKLGHDHVWLWPFDPHIKSSVVIDTGELQPGMARVVLQTAACLAKGFAAV
jgi:MinD-like ATPase involved in chromosome partitioning or flagellar assembly